MKENGTSMVGKTEKKTTMQQKTDVTTASVNVVNHLLKLIRNGYLRYRTEVKNCSPLK